LAFIIIWCGSIPWLSEEARALLGEATQNLKPTAIIAAAITTFRIWILPFNQQPATCGSSSRLAGEEHAGLLLRPLWRRSQNGRFKKLEFWFCASGELATISLPN
jgi:hypothetical protein